MDCRTFEDRLDEFEAGTLPAGDAAAANGHLETCPRCSSLHALASGHSDPLPRDTGDEMVSSILRRTTGTACAAAEPHLCDWVDGGLESADSEILSLHVAHCSNCSALAASLAELKAFLPSMANLEPDDRFTDDVLRATTGLPGNQRFIRGSAMKAGFWQRLFSRPRFAWESAYLGALLILLTLGNPSVMSKYNPRAVALSQVLIQSGDRILLDTSSVLAKKHDAAQQSLDGIYVECKSLLNAAVGLQTRTASELRRQATSFLEELKLAVLEEGPATPDRRDLH